MLVVGACGHALENRAITLGRYIAPSEQRLFERTSAAMMAIGYGPVFQDAQTGTLVTECRSRRAPVGSRLVVQLYREGWIVVAPQIPVFEDRQAAQRARTGARFADDEAEQFAVALRRELERFAASESRP